MEWLNRKESHMSVKGWESKECLRISSNEKKRKVLRATPLFEHLPSLYQEWNKEGMDRVTIVRGKGLVQVGAGASNLERLMGTSKYSLIQQEWEKLVARL